MNLKNEFKDELTNEYTLTRKVRAVSGQTTTTTFNVGAPTKFLKLTIPDTNVIDILSVFLISCNIDN